MIVMVSPMGAFAESATDGSRVPIGDKTDNEDNTVVLNTVNEASSENSTLKDAHSEQPAMTVEDDALIEREPSQDIDLTVDTVYGNEKSDVAASNVISETSADGLFTYVVQDDKAIITGYLGDSATVVFPETIDGYEVIALGNGSVISGMSNVVTVVISDGITQIGDSAFSRCSNLTGELVIPDSIETIGNSAFYDCNRLTSVTIGNGITSIAGGTFSWCNNIRSIRIDKPYGAVANAPWGATSSGYSIGCAVIWNDSILDADTGLVYHEDGDHMIVTGLYVTDSAITSIEIPAVYQNKPVTEISESAFNGYYRLTSVIIPESVTSIGNYAFKECGLTGELVISDNVETIGNGAFDGCEKLTSLVIGNGVTSIGNAAFAGCSGLTGELVIPDSVVTLGESAFHSCSNLTSVIIGDSVNAIASNMFNYCSKLSHLVIGNSVESIGSFAFYHCPELSGELIIPDSVKTMGQWAFGGGNKLTSVIIGDGLVSVGLSAFYGSSKITDLVIGENVGLISHCAFRNCSALKNITMPISAYPETPFTFDGCTNVKSITLTKGTGIGYNYTSNTSQYTPWYLNRNNVNGITVTIEDGVTSIGDYVFYNCTGLTGKFIVPDSVQTIGNHAFDGCNKLTSIAIGNNVTLISSYAFYDCTGLTGELVIPDGVQTIGSDAFNGCNKLTSVTIGNNVTLISGYAFRNCTGLTGELIIPDNVETIGYGAFYDCSNITSVTIGNNVTLISGYAFRNCTGLTGELIIPDNVETIEYGAFYDCSNITGVNIGNGITSIDRDVFSGCSGITNLVIGENVTSISSYAFYGCSGLTGELVIPDNVQTIDYGAFGGCSSITSVAIGNGITSIDNSTFFDCSNLRAIYIDKPYALIDGAPWSAKNCAVIWNDSIVDNDTGFVYYEDYDSMIITGFYDPSGSAISIEIPNDYQGKPVTISETAFILYTNFKAIHIDRPYGSFERTSWGITYPCAVIWNDSVIDIDTGFVYCEDNGSMIVTGLYSPDGVTTLLEIPSTYQGKPVTAIGDYAFYCYSDVTDLVISDNVGSIGDHAFSGCSSIAKITMPISAYPESEDSFSDCFNVYLVTLTKGTGVEHDYTLSTYKWTPWYIRSHYAYEEVPCSIQSGLSPLKNPSRGHSNGIIIVIDDEVTTIGDYTFYDCSGMVLIAMPVSAHPKSSNTFEGCINVSLAILTKGTGAAYNYTTSNYSWTPWYKSRDNLNGMAVAVADDVTSIGNYTFYGCSNITDLIIADSVVSIGSRAFNGCSALTNIKMPISVKIMSQAFTNCTNVNSVTLTKGTGTGYKYTLGTYSYTPWYQSRNNPDGITVTIEDGITSIGNYTFYGCKALAGELVIPDSVEAIGYRAFCNCTNLEVITILNPNCSIYDHLSTIYSGVTIIGYAGSTAESYAIKYRRAFEAIPGDLLSVK